MRLTGFKTESHGLPNDPANNDEEGSDTESNLNARSNSNTHGQIHLVPNGDNDSSDMFSGISNNRNQDETNESLANVALFDDVINAANKVFGTSGDENSDDDKDHASGNGTKMLLFFFVLLLLSLLLGVEKVAVCTELEHEVHDVENQENDGSAAGQGENAFLLFF